MFEYLFFLLFIANGLNMTVEDQCLGCGRYKEQQDCESRGNCYWTEEYGCSVSPTQVIITYCGQLKNSCSKTNGCAWINNSCTHFAGCTAYVKTSTRECNQISNKCISNGKTCIDALECSQYNKVQCNQTPNKFDRNCIWDKDFCRDYHCQDADLQLNTDDQCNQFIQGCITTGAGCIEPPLPPCSQLQGYSRTCNQMKGIDGYCEQEEGKTSCKAKICSDAPQSISNDKDCQLYQIGCVTTGKGCIDQLKECSTYQVTYPESECIGYIGTDGFCEGDKGKNKCRSRICKNMNGTTDQACNDYKKGCLTNGKFCVSIVPYCSGYSGTIITCQGYIGSDGKCKGTLDKNLCEPKDCIDDSDNKYNTDELCKQNIQEWCLTTGKGCVKTLLSCSTYMDQNDCLDRIGSEGKCKQGKNGYCEAKLCSDAPLELKTNEQCDKFRKGCVTNGKGCIDQTTCMNTLSRLSCDGTYENSTKCQMISYCTSNSSCSFFVTQSICQNYLTEYGSKCFWDQQNKACRLPVCKDFQYTTDYDCTTALVGCVTNGQNCVNTYDCSQFKGTQAICLSYTAVSCTNLISVTNENTACINKTCQNAPKDMTTDLQCSNYLSSCLTNGQGCIDNSLDCTFYTGNYNTCKNFTGYINSKRQQCWSNNSSDAACVFKTCNLAQSMTQNSDCEQFLTLCKFNGLGSCVDVNAPCSSYGYTTDSKICQNFKGQNGTISCWQGSNNQCRDKQCSDYVGNDQNCNIYFTGCILNGSSCVSPTTNCTSFTGTVDQCNQFIGNSKKCTKILTCKNKVCSEKSATSNSECLNYHSKCRISYGQAYCQEEEQLCENYKFSSSSNFSEMALYCNKITTSEGIPCAFDDIGLNCIQRKQCSQWVTGVSCTDYLGKNTCVENKFNNQCYQVDSCLNYQIPNDISDKESWCNAMKDQEEINCIYNTLQSQENCSYQNSCEKIDVDQEKITTATQCNTFSKSKYCQFSSINKCVTTQLECSSYQAQEPDKFTYCSTLKANNNGIVTRCKFISESTYCSTMQCADIISPKNQNDCNFVPRCKYYQNSCFEITKCQSYIFSSADDTHAKKRLFCQNMYDSDRKSFCSYLNGGNSCEKPIDNCNGFIGSDVDTCSQYRIKTGHICTWNGGERCTNSSNLCGNVPATNGDYCDLKTVPGLCKYSGYYCGLKNYQICESYNFGFGFSQAYMAQYCSKIMSTSGYYCSFKINQDHCYSPVTKCQDLSVNYTVDNLDYCQASKDQFGNICSYDYTSSNCRTALLCELAGFIGSQTDCDFYSSGCVYINGICLKYQDNCNQYKAIGNDNNQKLAYCNQLENSSFQVCTYLTGDTCINKGACSSYRVLDLSDATTKAAACAQVQTTDEVGCFYWNGQRSYCTTISQCSQYTGGNSTTITVDCAAVKDLNGNKCFGTNGSTSCNQFQTCEAIIGPTGQGDCDKYFDSCIYNQNKCYKQAKDCQYQVSGKSISFCSGFIDSQTGDKCTAQSDTSTTCQPRTCKDANIPNSTSNIGCSTYKSNCKSDGTKCIDGQTKCSQYQASDCSQALDYDNMSTCTSYPTSCINKDCNINDTSTTDNDCNSFRSGCVTNGYGCVEQTVPCSGYRGTVEVCQNFTGNYVKCWGKSKITIDYCRDRLCTDNNNATNDYDCQNFLQGCVTTGTGCVKAGSPCSVYIGTQNTCQNYEGPSGKCWSTSIDIIFPCIEKQCNLYSGKTDDECKKFMENCITNGKFCVPNTTTCAQFQGNLITCPKFSARDGPCKATNYSLQESSCTPRVCNEAPKFSNDQECYKYHPTCMTTGHGCISKYNWKCSDLQSSCNQWWRCQWVDQCTTPPSTCESMIPNGQSICESTILNDGITKCAWYKGTCRKMTCADQSAYLTTHEQCNKIDSDCTTTGQGCVKLGICSSYIDPNICGAAKTTEISKRCTWDGTISQCRQRQCSDNTYSTTDQECNLFLTGCKTKGKGCIQPPFDCSVFKTLEYCVKDADGNQCIFVGGVCYNYTACTDVYGLTLSDCQSFNSLCVPGPAHCIAQTSCDQYTNLQSCTIGINQTKCGWLPPGVCQIFGSCSDLVSTSNQECQNYGSNCISDGIKCIDKQVCSTYLIQTSCINGGTDGQCTWESGNCRSAVCDEKNGTTDDECYKFKVKYDICTTNGYHCISRQWLCGFYKSQASCTFTRYNEPCIYSYPVGQTTGIVSCRPKDCQDFKVLENEQCEQKIPSTICLFDGSKCVKKDKCKVYKNQKLCNSGGTDGVCIFTPAPTETDPLAGSCQLFTKCDLANNESICKRKSYACYWNTEKLLCSDKTCEDIQNANECSYIYSFQKDNYTICAFIDYKCQKKDESYLTKANCLRGTLYTHGWDYQTQKCVSCKRIEDPVPIPQIQLDITTIPTSISGLISITLIIIVS